MSVLKQKAGPGGAGVKSTDGTIIARLLSVRQVADLLGLKEATIYTWIASRRVPFVKLRRSVRIPADAIAALIAQNTVLPRQDGAQ